MTMQIQMDELMALRADLNEVSELRISVNDMLIKAMGIAGVAVPEANSHWGGELIRKYDDVDVSVAVSTPAGLITPIVKSANRRTLGDIATETKELVGKAREGTLQPDEFMVNSTSQPAH